MQERDLSVDGLRGVAILAVLALHWLVTPLQDDFPEWRWALQPLASGVDIFFVVSGYLIGGILLRHGGAPGFARTFLARRALRILPLYLLCVAVFNGPYLLIDWPPEGATPTWAYLVFVNNIYEAFLSRAPFELSPYWSLAIEEQFYLTGLLVAVLLGRRGLCAYAALAIVVSLALRLVLEPRAAWYFTLSHLDPIGIGLLCAVLAPRFRLGTRAAMVALAMFAAAPLLGLLLGRSAVALNTTLISLATALLLLSGRGCPRWAWLRWFGRRCFALYLLHQGVLFWTAAALGAATIYEPPRIVAFAILLLLAEASWRLLEAPCIAVGHRMSYRDAGLLPSDDVATAPSAVPKV